MDGPGLAPDHAGRGLPAARRMRLQRGPQPRRPRGCGWCGVDRGPDSVQKLRRDAPSLTDVREGRPRAGPGSRGPWPAGCPARGAAAWIAAPAPARPRVVRGGIAGEIRCRSSAPSPTDVREGWPRAGPGSRGPGPAGGPGHEAAARTAAPAAAGPPRGAEEAEAGGLAAVACGDPASCGGGLKDHRVWARDHFVSRCRAPPPCGPALV
jgi:hypothetical protein